MTWPTGASLRFGAKEREKDTRFAKMRDDMTRIWSAKNYCKAGALMKIIAYRLLPIAYCRLSIVDCRLSIVDCRLIGDAERERAITGNQLNYMSQFA
jgi:hypothetical protein